MKGRKLPFSCVANASMLLIKNERMEKNSDCCSSFSVSSSKSWNASMAVNSAFPTVLFPASLLPTMAVMPSRRIEALLILPSD